MLDLMIDAVYGEIVSAGPIDGDWRNIFRTTAQRIRQACHQYPCLVDLPGGRPHLGPNAPAMPEASLAALNNVSDFEDIDVAMRALGTVHAYVIGAAWSENSDLNSGMNRAEWQKLWWLYLKRVIPTGRFPLLAKVVRDASHPSPDSVFDAGLNTVLHGSATKDHC